MAILDKIFGNANERYLKRLQPVIEKINSLESKFEIFSNEQLSKKTQEFKERIKKGETLDDLLPESFALVREASKRTLNQRHFNVQLLAGIALHQGKIAEMKTGEGKTLSATLPLYLNALTGLGCHLATVNDYLAKRDTVWMGQIYHLLGLSVGCLVHEKAYLYDPQYYKEGETKDLKIEIQDGERDKERDIFGGFKIIESYLRPVPRKEAYLADITYGTNNEFGFDYLKDNLVLGLEEMVQRDFNFAIVDEVDSILIDEARTPLIISHPDYQASELYKEFSRIVPQLKSEIDYEIDEKMKVVTLTETGIKKVEKILGIENIYEEKGIKYLHYLEQSLRAQAINPSTGQPLFSRDRDYIVKNGQVIIVDEFTGRLMPGRRWSGGLHQALEAKERLEIQPESRTLATITFQNLFRMYKKLAGMTGTAITSAEEFEKVYRLETIIIPTNKPMIREDLPDKVYKTEEAKFKAIINEIKERHQKGQPILIGTNSIEKNEYLAKLLNREGIYPNILNAKHHEKEALIIAQAGRKGGVTVATNMAGRGVDIILGGYPPPSKTKNQISNVKIEENEDFKKWKEEQEEVKELGGLHVIGVQRHEARRIDNQLRGRAGRQGDPGSSQFFLSLEDELLRIFGGEKVKKIIEIFKLPEDEPIETKILSDLIEKAQAKIEGLNFDLRKHILEYDDVIAKHRNKIYSQRKEIFKMSYQGLKNFVLECLNQEIIKIIEIHSQEKIELSKIIGEIKTILPISPELEKELEKISEREKIEVFLKNLTQEFFKIKEEGEKKENLEKILKFVSLKNIDLLWIEHLENMEYLKDAVQLQTYGGKDPLVEYKIQGHYLFQNLWEKIKTQISRTVFKFTIRWQ